MDTKLNKLVNLLLNIICLFIEGNDANSHACLSVNL
jgi:hypothetical protein